MNALLERLQQLAEMQDVDEYLRHRWEFHATCYRTSSRHRLVDEVERLFWRSDRYNRLVLSTLERFRESVGRYRQFLAACEANDGVLAEQVIHDTIRWGLDRVAPGLPSEASSPVITARAEVKRAMGEALVGGGATSGTMPAPLPRR